MSCKSITDGVIAALCCDPAIGGTHGDIILVNYADIDRGLTTVVDNVITNLILKQGSKAYKYESLEDVPMASVSYEKGTYIGYFQHDVTLRFLVKNEDVKSFVNSLSCARVVAIVHNKELGSDGDMSYEVYGFDSGLELNSLEGTTEVTDGVVYEAVTGSGDRSKEKSLPKTLNYGTLSDTEDAIDGLLNPAAPL